MNYDQLIYELLLEYLPGKSSTLTDLELLFSLSSSELDDIRKFLLWFFVAFYQLRSYAGGIVYDRA